MKTALKKSIPYIVIAFLLTLVLMLSVMLVQAVNLHKNGVIHLTHHNPTQQMAVTVTLTPDAFTYRDYTVQTAYGLEYRLNISAGGDERLINNLLIAVKTDEKTLYEGALTDAVRNGIGSKVGEGNIHIGYMLDPQASGDFTDVTCQIKLKFAVA